MFVGTSAQLCAAKNVANIVVAGASLHPTDDLKSLDVVIDSRLTFATHALAVRRTSSYRLCDI